MTTLAAVAGWRIVRRALCMICPTVEQVGLRRMRFAVAVASLTAVAGLLVVTTAVLANGDAAAAALTVSRYRAAAQRLASRQLGRKRLEADSGLPSLRDLEGDPPMPRVKKRGAHHDANSVAAADGGGPTRAQPAQGRFGRP
jgi:hypothetical protein